MSEYGPGCMTYATAHGYLEDLQRIITRYRYLFNDDVATANGLAILAAEKQIPQKPINFNITYTDNSAIRSGDCPHCGNHVLDIKKYCGDCGQRLEWNIHE